MIVVASIRRRFVIGGLLTIPTTSGLLLWLAFREPQARVAVGVDFVHTTAYPPATITVWVTNRSNRLIRLGNVAVRFRAESGREIGGLIWSSSPWQGAIEPPLPGSLRPGAVATLSVPGKEDYKEARLLFDYNYDADLARRAVSRCVGFGVQKFHLRPRIDTDALSVVSTPVVKTPAPATVWQRLLRTGMLNGCIRTGYQGPWVPWHSISNSDH